MGLIPLLRAGPVIEPPAGCPGGGIRDHFPQGTGAAMAAQRDVFSSLRTAFMRIC